MKELLLLCTNFVFDCLDAQRWNFLWGIVAPSIDFLPSTAFNSLVLFWWKTMFCYLVMCLLLLWWYEVAQFSTDCTWIHCWVRVVVKIFSIIEFAELSTPNLDHLNECQCINRPQTTLCGYVRKYIHINIHSYAQSSDWDSIYTYSYAQSWAWDSVHTYKCKVQMGTVSVQSQCI